MNRKIVCGIILASLVLILSSTIALAATPEYSVVITSEKPAVNPNESLKFKVYITGGGEPPVESKIAVYTDGSYNITRIWVKDSSNAKPHEPDPPIPYFIYASLPRYLFDVHDPPKPKIFAEIEGMVKFGIIEYEVFIPEDIRPGDHETHIVFSYNDSTKWHTEEAVFKFHVNTWYERYQSLLILSAAVVVVDSLINILINIWNWLKRRNLFKKAWDRTYNKKKEK